MAKESKISDYSPSSAKYYKKKPLTKREREYIIKTEKGKTSTVMPKDVISEK